MPDFFNLALSITGLLVLGLAALIDARTGRIPDPLIFTGLLIVTVIQGVSVSWDNAAQHLSLGIAASLLIWAVNEIWYRLFGHDALGMGDAKWTMLAVACFGIKPALFAWGLGACLAVLWLGVIRLIHRRVTHVRFAPFLLIGLVCGLCWLRTLVL